MATEGTNKGTFANIYEVNKAFPGGGAAGEYVVILGFKHYWNPDRNNWCVNENRDEYWDEALNDATTAANNAIIAVQTEQAAREAGDATLQARINAEETARKSADTALQTSIDTEKSAREAGDAALQTRIGTEEQTRGARDAELSKRIDDEVSARTAGDSMLQNTISTFQNSLNEESSARAAADSHLQELITIETQARSNADAELQKDIEEEANTRQQTMESLAKNVKSMIDEEKYYREAGDTVLTEALDAEKTNREDKDNELERTLQALVLGAKASCVVSPNVIYKNTTTEVSVTGSISNVKATAISIEGDNYKKSTDEDTGSFDTVFPIQTSKDITFIVKATYNGAVFPASAMLYAVDKIYYGAGTSASAATNVVSPRRTPAGTYSLTTQSGDYVWWLVPSTMSISKATLNGFNFPIKQDGTTSVDGVSYKIYKSENQYSASTMNIVVS